MPVQRALSDLGASTAVVGGSPASAHLSTERILSPGLSKLLRHCESVLPQEPPLSMMGIPLRSIERHRPVEQTSGRHSALLDLLNARLRFRRAPMDVALIVFTSGWVQMLAARRGFLRRRRCGPYARKRTTRSCAGAGRRGGPRQLH